MEEVLHVVKIFSQGTSLGFTAGMHPRLEVCMGPGLVPRSGPGSSDSNHMLYRIFRAFSGHSFITKK
jgi:hypothetical protein